MMIAFKKTLILICSVGLLVSCAGESGATMQPVVPIDAQGFGTPFDPSRVWVSTLGSYCLDVPGTATITVDLVDAEGLHLDAFGVTPGGGWALGDSGTMKGHDLSEAKELTQVCPLDPHDEDQSRRAAINIQFSMDEGVTEGQIESAVVRWDTGDREGQIAVPIEMKVFQPK